MKKYSKAFTLAELLIAMFLFALIAVMLIPNTVRNSEQKLFETQLRKTYGDVQQAFLWILSEHQGSMKGVICQAEVTGSQCIRDLLAGDDFNKKKLEFIVTYDSTSAVGGANATPQKDPGTQADAYRTRNPLFLNEQPVNGLAQNVHNNFFAVNLKNGATVSAIFDNTCSQNMINYIAAAAPNINVCGYVEIDTNAGKAPNVVGKDIHYFWITERDGLLPFGEVDSLTCGNPNNNGAYNNDNDKPVDSSQNSPQSQLGCTARLLNMGRIDYY